MRPLLFVPLIPPPRNQGVCSKFVCWWDPVTKTVMWQFLNWFVCGTPRTQWLGSKSAPFSPLERPRVRWPLVILTPSLGTPENARVTGQFPAFLGPLRRQEECSRFGLCHLFLGPMRT